MSFLSHVGGAMMSAYYNYFYALSLVYYYSGGGSDWLVLNFVGCLVTLLFLLETAAIVSEIPNLLVILVILMKQVPSVIYWMSLYYASSVLISHYFCTPVLDISSFDVSPFLDGSVPVMVDLPHIPQEPIVASEEAPWLLPWWVVPLFVTVLIVGTAAGY